MIRTSLARNVALRKLGRRGAEWERVRRAIKPKFERAGITRCELGWHGCLGGIMLGFAHAKARRNLGPGELSVVILACQKCHQALDLKPDEEQERIALETIAARESQP